jgi:hypothetical protein
MNYHITLKNGTIIEAQFVRAYGAFEGGMRYIFKSITDGREYRCVKESNGNYVEYRA